MDTVAFSLREEFQGTVTQEIEIRRLERIYRAASTPVNRPDRDQRRTLRRLKRGE